MPNSYFYTIGVAFMGGIFARSFLPIGGSGIAFLLIVSLTLFVAWNIQRSSGTSPLVFLSIASFVCALGVAWLQHVDIKPSVVGEFEGSTVSIVGKVAREPEVRETTTHIYVRPDIEDSSRELVLITTDRFSEAVRNVQYGDQVIAEGTLKKPESFSTDEGRTFNYPGYLRARGVQYMIPFAEVRIESKAMPTLLPRMFQGKQLFEKTVERFIKEPESGLAEGVLLGVRRALGEELEEVFRETGIIHIVVLSGYNVMIIVEAMTLILGYIFLPKMRMVIGVGVIALFALLVGLSATVVRASIMAGMLLIARGTGRTYTILRALTLAGVIMLLINPYLLVHDPGFQLSFLATFGLILFSPYVEEKLRVLHPVPLLRGIVAATISTQFIIFPLLLYHTGIFSAVSILTNVLVLPVVPFAMLFTFLTGMLGMVSTVLGVVWGFVTHVLLAYIIGIATLCASLPFSAFSISAFSFWWVVFAYGVMAIVVTRILSEKDTLTYQSITEVENDYDGWVIEEEKEKPAEERSSSAGVRSSLPFR